MQLDSARSDIEDLRRENPEIDKFELEDDGTYLIHVTGLRDATLEKLSKLHAAVESFGIKALLIDNLNSTLE